jgi:hypothetical protein
LLKSQAVVTSLTYSLTKTESTPLLLHRAKQLKMTTMNTPLVTWTSNASLLVDVTVSSTASNDHDCDDDSSIATNSSFFFFFVAEEDDESFFSFDLSCKVDLERSPSSVPRRHQQRRYALPVLLRRHINLEGDSLFPDNKEQQDVDHMDNYDDDDDEEDSVLALLRNRASNTNPNHKSWSDKALEQIDWEGADWEGKMVIELPLPDDDDDDDDAEDDDDDMEDDNDVEDAERGDNKNQNRNKESIIENHSSSKRMRYSHRQERQSHRYHPSPE